MHIAILGAGFSGLATAWHLLQTIPKVRVTLFDQKGIGGGASGVAAGLLHPYAGAHAKKNWCGEEGMEAALQLIEVSAKALNTPVANPSGLFRAAITPEQKREFKKAAEAACSDVFWWGQKQYEEKFSQWQSHEGIWIPSALTVYPELYLQGLWEACQRLGSCLEIIKIKSLAELEAFDLIIVAAGAASNLFPELAHLPIHPVKGQVIDLELPDELSELPSPLNSQAYLIPNPRQKKCLIGATFEHYFKDESPQRELAWEYLKPKVATLDERLATAHLMGCRAGIRATTPNHQPIATHIKDRIWILSGMGSKGLLYHALFAKKLVHEITGEHYNAKDKDTKDIKN